MAYTSAQRQQFNDWMSGQRGGLGFTQDQFNQYQSNPNNFISSTGWQPGAPASQAPAPAPTPAGSIPPPPPPPPPAPTRQDPTPAPMQLAPPQTMQAPQANDQQVGIGSFMQNQFQPATRPVVDPYADQYGNQDPAGRPLDPVVDSTRPPYQMQTQSNSQSGNPQQDFSASFNSTVGQPNYDPRFDMDGNGVINASDQIAFAQNGMQGVNVFNAGQPSDNPTNIGNDRSDDVYYGGGAQFHPGMRAPGDVLRGSQSHNGVTFDQFLRNPTLGNQTGGGATGGVDVGGGGGGPSTGGGAFDHAQLTQFLNNYYSSQSGIGLGSGVQDQIDAGIGYTGPSSIDLAEDLNTMLGVDQGTLGTNLSTLGTNQQTMSDRLFGGNGQQGAFDALNTSLFGPQSDSLQNRIGGLSTLTSQNVIDAISGAGGFDRRLGESDIQTALTGAQFDGRTLGGRLSEIDSAIGGISTLGESDIRDALFDDSRFGTQIGNALGLGDQTLSQRLGGLPQEFLSGLGLGQGQTVGNRFDTLGTQIGGLDSRLSQINPLSRSQIQDAFQNTQFGDNGQTLGTRFNDIDTEFEGITNRFDNSDERFNQILGTDPTQNRLYGSEGFGGIGGNLEDVLQARFGNAFGLSDITQSVQDTVGSRQSIGDVLAGLTGDDSAISFDQSVTKPGMFGTLQTRLNSILQDDPFKATSDLELADLTEQQGRQKDQQLEELNRLGILRGGDTAGVLGDMSEAQNRERLQLQGNQEARRDRAVDQALGLGNLQSSFNLGEGNLGLEGQVQGGRQSLDKLLGVGDLGVREKEGDARNKLLEQQIGLQNRQFELDKRDSDRGWFGDIFGGILDIATVVPGPWQGPAGALNAARRVT